MKTFREAVQGEQFSISAELTVTRESTADDVRRQADVLGNYVDGIQVTDNPYAWVQMSALSAAGILIDHGVDAVPIMTCRDRNRIALQSDLLGLQALVAKAAVGARFMQTQLCFNMEILRYYMECFVEAKLTRSYSAIVTLSPLPSATTARWVKENLSDSRTPDAVIQRLEDAKSPEQEGIAICAELMQEISGIPGVSGVNLMTTGDTGTIPAAIKASGLRS